MPTILIVDDDADNRYLLETLLQSQGYTTRSAGNGAEALQIAHTETFDLVIADILMPVMDGFSLCRVWKQDPRLFRIPFAFYTATYVEAKDEQFALNLGADCFLLKPLPPETILQEVRNLLARQTPARLEPGLPVDDSTFIAEHNQVLTRKLEKKLADNERLEARNAQLGKILAASQNEILVFDGIQLRFTFMNQKVLEHLGYDDLELRSLTPLELCPELSAEAFGAMLDSLRVGTQEKLVLETSFRKKDGSTYPVALNLEPILNGRELSFLAVVQDITQRRRLEAELRQAQKLEALGVLVAGVAHNFNNVLAAIMGTASMREMEATEAKDLEAYRIICEACRRGRDVVKSMVHFSQPSLSAAAPLELRALITEVLALLGSTTLNRIRIRERFATEPLWILGNTGDLNHALMNICINALAAMPAGGTLTIQTALVDLTWAEISLEDDGEGMTPEVLSHALDPFFTTKESGKGTGLGLSTTYGVVKAHGGTLDISSTPGQGTTVKLRFPRISLPAAASVHAKPTPSLGPLKVLLVDDDEDVRILMARMFEKAGHQVKGVANGKGALESLAAGPLPDLVILDQNMPGLTGVQLLERVRATHPDLPIIISSGQLDLDKWPCFKQPNVGIISKPFDMAELQAKLAGFLGLGRNED